VRLPEGMSTRDAMAIGTAGYTAMLSVLALEKHGLSPKDGPIVVTGAADILSVARTVIGSDGAHLATAVYIYILFLFFVFAYPYLEIIDFSYFTAAVVALSVYTSAFICEVVRSGINTVPLGQAEAARALGLTFGQTLSQVVLPQAMRSVVPPMVSTLIALLKNTTIAAGFSVAEAGRIRAVLSDDGENQLLGLLWVSFGFIVLVMVLTVVQRTLERRWSVAR